MNNFVKSLPIRINYKYYQFRINTITDPYRIQLRNSPYRVLFILSHMRSGSSLLTHLLISNPEIMGYGETHLNYSSEKDLKELIFKLYWRFKDLKMNHKYVLDKVLHNHKILDDSILKSENIYLIFLLREPEKTLKSILQLKSHLNEEQALQYYIHRLDKLNSYAEMIDNKKHCLFITYEQVLNQSQLVFQTLQDFLGTKIGFSEEYQVLQTTGIRGIGDSSENIKAGRIIRQKRDLEISISPELQEQADQSFEKSYQILFHYCQTI